MPDPDEWFFEYSLECPEVVAEETAEEVFQEAREWARPFALELTGGIRAAPPAAVSASWVLSFRISGRASGKLIPYGQTGSLTVHLIRWCRDRGWSLKGGPREVLPEDPG
jgi:hypothetical protein